MSRRVVDVSHALQHLSRFLLLVLLILAPAAANSRRVHSRRHGACSDSFAFAPPGTFVEKLYGCCPETNPRCGRKQRQQQLISKSSTIITSTNTNDSFSKCRASSGGEKCCRRHLSMSAGGDVDDDLTTTTSVNTTADWSKVVLFGTIGFLYWYWMVLGSLAAANGWPGIPDFLPLVPGWPPSEADLQPVLEDSRNFFYLSDLLGDEAAPYVQPVRLASFNIAEAWIFAYLPALWSDSRRINRWILLLLWSVLGINLTNAFLAPYLLVTEIKGTGGVRHEETPGKNKIVSACFGSIAAAVAGYAVLQCLTVASTSDWEQFRQLIMTDRSYLAFVIDLILFSIFQPVILSRTRNNGNNNSTDYIPLIGLILWLLNDSENNENNETY